MIASARVVRGLAKKKMTEVGKDTCGLLRAVCVCVRVFFTPVHYTVLACLTAGELLCNSG